MAEKRSGQAAAVIRSVVGRPLIRLPACPSLRFGLVVRVFRHTSHAPVPFSQRDALIWRFHATRRCQRRAASLANFAGSDRSGMRARSQYLALTTAVSRIQGRRSTAKLPQGHHSRAHWRHHLRDRVRLVRVFSRGMRKAHAPFRHGKLWISRSPTGFCLAGDS